MRFEVTAEGIKVFLGLLLISSTQTNVLVQFLNEGNYFDTNILQLGNRK